MINLFLKTYGCQANVADSQALEAYLVTLGCRIVDHEDQADLIIINTCAIREKAEQKVFSYIGQLAENKKKKPYLNIGVIGCIASYRKKELFIRFDHVSFVFGAKDDLVDLKDYLSDLILKLETIKNIYTQDSISVRSLKSKLKKLKTIFDAKVSDTVISKGSDLALGGVKDKPKELKQSFVNIMTGCNNYCSYCIVPFTRGREKSYSSDVLLQRVKQDIQNGVKVITLLGQNVNSYKDPLTGHGFEWLLEQIALIDGEFWVRFVSAHPKDMTIDVLDVIAKYNDKLCAFLHFPLQSGSNTILEAMNRTYTKEKYMKQIGWIRDKLPDATITTDIIVGFPGETEEDYRQTREVMEQVKYDLVYSFVYSPRKYTKAALLPDNTSETQKMKRLQDLQKRQIEICFEQNSLNIGKIFKTLVEKRLANGKLLARTEGNVRILLDGDDDLIGSFVTVKVESTGPANMLGSVIENIKAA